MAKVTCPHCDSDNESGSEVCFNCGRGLFVLTKGSVLDGRYEIRNLLGKGGMGVVYKAHDRDLDEIVAVKVLRPDVAHSSEMAVRFRSEIRLARKIRHENVCGIHEYGSDGQIRYIVMEYVEGTDFKQVLRQAGAMPADEAYAVVVQITRGLEAIHNAGVIHRDLKTPNIMRDRHGRVRLMDFGIAKSLQTESSAGATATGHLVGTPEYMSPEQARAERLDGRSDVYALGIVAFELFTGELPFRGDTPMSTLLMQLQMPPPLREARAARLPPPLIPVLEKALAKDRKARFASAREMRAAIEAARDAGTAALGTTMSSAPTAESGSLAHDLAEARPQTLSAPTQDVADALTQVRTPVPTSMPTGVSTDMLPSPPQQSVREPLSPGATVASSAPLPAQTRPRMAVLLGRPVAAAAMALSVGVGAWWMIRQGEKHGGAEQAPAPGTTLAIIAQPTAVTESTVAPTARVENPGTEPRSPGVRSTPGPKPDKPAPAFVAAPPKAAQLQEPSSVLSVVPSGAPPTTTLAAAAVAVPSVPPTTLVAPEPSEQPPPETLPAAAPPESTPAASRESPVAAAPGYLVLTSKPQANAVIDGQAIGPTPIQRFALSPGAHRLVLHHPKFEPLLRSIFIESGATLKIQVDLGDEAVKKR